ncbi:hypothetical protein N7471_007915 [Penicillium samsonianum]|uniref:uncharacterized protein n=1 Tax=Penicillium samsonianum TaxID=1882272 RepID=UPI002548C355|nr:uncharacterized protein N7471_007915 [Penicillium samsonianum]KAJ6132700.1 hypothetical protein N7471_007915 [Penicillium samsonianum]
MGTSKIAEAQHGLLRAISILTGIVPRDWSGWSRFSEIFFPPNDADAKRRRDINIPKFTKEELEDEFFLGDTNLASHFVAHRWIYFPIVLNETKQDSYEKNHRLPLLLPLFQEDHVRRQGGYGVVTKEIIPPHHIILGVMSDHLGIPGPEAPYRFELTVGRKRLPRADSANEVKQLKLLRSSLSSHKRIVSDLAIFTVGNELNIIMPWADMDLEDFLAGGYEQMQPTPCLLTELIQESKNVASAIHFLHKNLQLEVLEVERPDFRHQAICHADLKPRNILVFKHEGSSTGIWRITDFGVSRVANRAPSETSRYGSGYPTSLDARPPRGGAYRAPDTHAQRRSDVWSFGCILVRVFALGLEPASLPELDERRKEGPGGRALDDCFYRENPSALNPSVENWIQHLPTRYRDSHSPAFLEKMQKLLGSMLEINYRNRLSARKVRRDLHALHYSLIHSDSDAPPSTQIALRNLLSGSSRTSSTSSTSSSSTAISNIGTVYPPRPVKEVGVLVAVMKDGGNINLVRQILRDQVDVEKVPRG